MRPSPARGSSRAAPAALTLVNWNLEWAPRSRRERISRRLDRLAPDVLCATEADREILPRGGHVAESGSDYGYGHQPARRKALLWSRWPLEDVDAVGDPGLPPGRFVAATCRTPFGPLRLVAVCVPWSHARVRRAGRAVWQDHLDYLERLGPILSSNDRDVPLVVVGDFNQRIPRRRAPIAAAEALRRALGDLVVATAGDLSGIDRQVIDHVAHSPGLRVAGVEGIDRHDADGRRLSDHDAVRVRLLV
jgi:endonuclease/exonuclease/phosphatase family metal-dependent hydrolase